MIFFSLPKFSRRAGGQQTGSDRRASYVASHYRKSTSSQEHKLSRERLTQEQLRQRKQEYIRDEFGRMRAAEDLRNKVGVERTINARPTHLISQPIPLSRRNANKRNPQAVQGLAIQTQPRYEFEPRYPPIGPQDPIFPLRRPTQTGISNSRVETRNLLRKGKLSPSQLKSEW